MGSLEVNNVPRFFVGRIYMSACLVALTKCLPLLTESSRVTLPHYCRHRSTLFLSSLFVFSQGIGTHYILDDLNARRDSCVAHLHSNHASSLTPFICSSFGHMYVPSPRVWSRRIRRLTSVFRLQTFCKDCESLHHLA